MIRKRMHEFWVAQIVYTVPELEALPIEVRGPLQKKIDTGDLILSGGEIAVPLVCYEGEDGPAAQAAQEEAIARMKQYADRGHRVKVVANLDVEL